MIDQGTEETEISNKKEYSQGIQKQCIMREIKKMERVRMTF